MTSLSTVVAGLFLAVLACGDPARRPDVVLLTVDTLRADRVGAYGHAAAETPSIDRLAERGLLFLRAATPMPRTTPGLASLLTGLRPHRHGSREVGRSLRGPEEVTLLAELLGRSGYFSVAVSSSGAADPSQGLGRGFDRFVTAAELADRRAEEVADRALRELAEAPRDAPLLLWVHFVDPHAPYEPPPPWGDRAAACPCQELLRLADERGWEAGHFFSNRDGASSRALESCSALYDAEVAYTDHHLGRVLAGFDETRGLDGAVVVLTADHGENFGEQGLYYQHGPSLHEASLRVPLIVVGPGVPRGRAEERPVGLEDVLPTLLGRLDLDVPHGLDGRDLFRYRGLRSFWSDPSAVTYAEAASALMEHNSLYLYSGRSGGLHCFNGPRFSLCTSRSDELRLYDRERDPDFEEDVSARYPDALARLREAAARWQPEEVRERSVRDLRFKLVERPRLSGGYRRLLFDLVEDPAEEVDVARDHPEVVRHLGPLLERFTAELPTHTSWERDVDELEALEALGYLE
jgi:arylsulfatase A-like enzyme